MKADYKRSLEKVYKDIISFYNSDPNYFLKLKKRGYGYRLVVEILELIKNRNIKILDVGCGTGNLVSILYNKGFKNIEGIDECQKFINYARKNNSIVFHNTNFLKFKTQNKYDYIIAVDLLEHAIHPNLMLKKFEELLNDDGFLIIQGPNLLQIISQNQKLTPSKVYLFIKKFIGYTFFKKVHTCYIKPQLNKRTHQIDDSDACYLINPFDILIFLDRTKLKKIYFSTFYNPLQRYGKLKKRIALLLSKLPIIRYCGGSLLIVAEKKSGSSKIAKKSRIIQKKIQSLY